MLGACLKRSNAWNLRLFARHGAWAACRPADHLSPALSRLRYRESWRPVRASRLANHVAPFRRPARKATIPATAPTEGFLPYVVSGPTKAELRSSMSDSLRHHIFYCSDALHVEFSAKVELRQMQHCCSVLHRTGGASWCEGRPRWPGEDALSRSGRRGGGFGGKCRYSI